MDLGAACPDHVEVRLLKAGHCPHDEQPDQVNQEIISFLRKTIMKGVDGQGGEGSSSAGSLRGPAASLPRGCFREGV